MLNVLPDGQVTGGGQATFLPGYALICSAGSRYPVGGRGAGTCGAHYSILGCIAPEGRRAAPQRKKNQRVCSGGRRTRAVGAHARTLGPCAREKARVTRACVRAFKVERQGAVLLSLRDMARAGAIRASADLRRRGPGAGGMARDGARGTHIEEVLVAPSIERQVRRGAHSADRREGVSQGRRRRCRAEDQPPPVGVDLRSLWVGGWQVESSRVELADKRFPCS